MTIDVLPIGDHDWSVSIREGKDADTTTHKVSVNPETLSTLGASDEETLVREAVATYLEHEPGTALPHDVDFDWFEHHVEDFLDELTARLS